MTNTQSYSNQMENSRVELLSQFARDNVCEFWLYTSENVLKFII